MAHSFYAHLAPPIVVGVLLTCQSLDPEYKTAAFFQMFFQEKNIVLYLGQYGKSLPYNIFFLDNVFHLNVRHNMNKNTVATSIALRF